MRAKERVELRSIINSMLVAQQMEKDAEFKQDEKNQQLWNRAIARHMKELKEQFDIELPGYNAMQTFLRG